MGSIVILEKGNKKLGRKRTGKTGFAEEVKQKEKGFYWLTLLPTPPSKPARKIPSMGILR